LLSRCVNGMRCWSLLGSICTCRSGSSRRRAFKLPISFPSSFDSSRGRLFQSQRGCFYQYLVSIKRRAVRIDSRHRKMPTSSESYPTFHIGYPILSPRSHYDAPLRGASASSFPLLTRHLDFHRFLRRLRRSRSKSPLQ
jgi:hypothetical protein